MNQFKIETESLMKSQYGVKFSQSELENKNVFDKMKRSEEKSLTTNVEEEICHDNGQMSKVMKVEELKNEYLENFYEDQCLNVKVFEDKQKKEQQLQKKKEEGSTSVKNQNVSVVIEKQLHRSKIEKKQCPLLNFVANAIDFNMENEEAIRLIPKYTNFYQKQNSKLSKISNEIFINKINNYVFRFNIENNTNLEYIGLNNTTIPIDIYPNVFPKKERSSGKHLVIQVEDYKRSKVQIFNVGGPKQNFPLGFAWTPKCKQSNILVVDSYKQIYNCIKCADLGQELLFLIQDLEENLFEFGNKFINKKFLKANDFAFGEWLPGSNCNVMEGETKCDQYRRRKLSKQMTKILNDTAHPEIFRKKLINPEEKFSAWIKEFKIIFLKRSIVEHRLIIEFLRSSSYENPGISWRNAYLIMCCETWYKNNLILPHSVPNVMQGKILTLLGADPIIEALQRINMKANIGLDQMSRFFNNGNAAIAGITRMATETRDTIAAKIPECANTLRTFLVGLAINLYVMFQTTDVKIQIASAINIMNVLPYDVMEKQKLKLFATLKKVTEKVVNIFKRKQEANQENQMQSRTEVEEDSEFLLTSIIKLILGFFKRQNITSVKIEDFRIKRLVTLSKCIGSMTNVTDFLKEAFEKIFSVTEEVLVGEDGIRAALKDIDEGIPNWMTEVDGLELQIQEGGKILCPIDLKSHQTKLQLVRLQLEGNRILKRITVCNPTNSKIETYFKAKLTKLNKLIESLKASLVGMRAKHEPLVIYLHGGPGVGKSLLVDPLCAGIYACQGERYDFETDKYSKPDTTEFWDGYAMQKVHLIDDFLQNQNPDSRYKSLIDLIQIGSRAPVNLDMAHLENKGMTFYNSDIVVITAQMKFPKDVIEKFIVSNGAFERRVDMFIEVKVKKEFAAKGKFNREIVDKGFVPEAVEARITYRNGANTKFIGFKELVMKCALAHEKKKISEDILDQDMERNFVNWEEEFNKMKVDLNPPVVPQENVVQGGRFSSLPVKQIDPKEIVEEQKFFDAAEYLCGEPTHYARRDDNDFAELYEQDKKTLEDFVFGRVKGNIQSKMTTIDGYYDSFQILALMEDRARRRAQMCDTKSMASRINTIAPFVSLGVVLVSAFGFYKAYQSYYGEVNSDLDVEAEKTKPDPNIKICKDEADLEAGMMSGDDRTSGQIQRKYVLEGDQNVEANQVTEMTCRMCGTKVRSDVAYYKRTYFVCINKDCKKYRPTVEAEKELVNLQKSTEIAASQNFSEGVRDESMFVVARSLYNNLFTIKCVETGFKMHGIFITGTTVIFPSHVFCTIDDFSEATIEIESKTMSVTQFSMKDLQYHVDKTKDLIVLVLPSKQVTARRTITHHFITEQDVQQYYDEAYVLKIDRANKNLVILQNVKNLELGSKLDYYYTDANKRKYKQEIVSHLRYEGDTGVGDCGAPVFLQGTVFVRKIVGFHVAGNVGVGFSSIITQECLKKYMSAPETIFEYPVVNGNVESKILKPDMCVEIVGGVAPSKQVASPSITQIRKSVLYGKVFEPTTKPAMLYPANGLDPMEIGVKKAFVQSKPINQENLDSVVQSVVNKLYQKKSKYDKRSVLTDKEALNGIFGDPWICPINLHTSSGYPWVLDVSNGKFDLIEGEIPNAKLREEVQSIISLREIKAKKGLAHPVVFVDTKKDERRSFEKVDAGKTRIFSCGPVDFNILVRKYYLPFIARLMENHVFGECSVGLNAHSEEWKMMYTDLKAKGDEWIAGDYGAYDKRLPYQVMMACADVVNNFYKDSQENQTVRTTLMQSMSSGFRMLEDSVYRIHHGMPSGVPITAVVNSLANSILFRLAFLEIAIKEFGEVKGKVVAVDFDKYVSLKAYGDDHILRVSKLVPWYNMPAISEYYSSIGLEYTTATKGAILDQYTFEDDLQYLKRKFVLRGGKCYAPLDRNSINEMINWVRKSKDPIEAMRQNVVAACLEMSHYPKNEWNEFYDKVQFASREIGFPCPNLNFDVCHWLIREGGDYENHELEAINQELQKKINLYLKGEAKIKTLKMSKMDLATIKEVHKQFVDYIVKESLNKMQMDASESLLITESANVGAEVSREEGITTFTEQAKLNTNTTNEVQPLLPELDTYGIQTIREFIERPVLVNNFTWKTDMIGRVATYSFPDSLFNIKSIWDKLKNFRYFRGNVKISIRMNGTKFHYGRLLCAWYPQGANGVFAPGLSSPSDNIVTMSSCPNIILTPTSNEVQELIIPFSLPFFFIDLDSLINGSLISHNIAQALNEIGQLQMWILNPLLGNDENPPPVHVSVFAQFVDTQIGGYTVGRTDYIKSTLIPDPITSVPTYSLSYLGKGTVTVENQMQGLNDDRKGSKEAQNKSSSHIVSSALSTVSAVAGGLSFIPAVGLVGKVISGVTAGAAGIARFFGYSKPCSEETIQYFTMNFPNLAHSKGLDTARSLGTYAGNKVGEMNQWMGSSKEEMILQNIIQRPGLLWQTKVTANITPGTRLFMIPVTPMTYMISDKQETTRKEKAYKHPFAFVASCFLYWRGSTRYKIQFVASAFHAARFRVCWHPAIPQDVLESPLVTETNVVSHVVDISTDTEYELTIPYLSALPMLTNSPMTHNGYISVTLLNTLTHPSLNVPPIFINVWVAGSDDVQFGRPDSRFLLNYTSLAEEETDLDQENEMQGQQIEQGRFEPLVSAKSNFLNNMLNGEEIVHVKELTARPCYRGTVQNNKEVYNFWGPFISQIATPFNQYFKKIFRYARGATAVKVIKTGETTTISLINTDISKTVTNGFYNAPTLVANSNDGQIYSPAGSRIIAEAVVPYYSNQLFVPVSQGGINILSVPAVLIQSTAAGSLLYEYTGDDFEYGYQIGPHMMICGSLA
nr:TPA_asm: hypothetical protein [Dendrolac virus]